MKNTIPCVTVDVVERLWRTVKYEGVYLRGYSSLGELTMGCLTFSITMRIDRNRALETGRLMKCTVTAREEELHYRTTLKVSLSPQALRKQGSAVPL